MVRLEVAVTVEPKVDILFAVPRVLSGLREVAVASVEGDEEIRAGFRVAGVQVASVDLVQLHRLELYNLWSMINYYNKEYTD